MARESDEHDRSDAPEEHEQLRETVRAFLADVDRTLNEYDQGYADADATLRLLRSHVDDLRERLDD